MEFFQKNMENISKIDMEKSWDYENWLKITYEKNSQKYEN